MSNIYKILKRSWNKGVLLLLLLTFCTTILFAQTAVIRGTVKDESGEPMVGAVVMQVGTKNAAPVTKDGTFELKNVTPGATLQVNFLGYKTAVTALKSGQTTVSFVLKSNTIGLKEVTVNTGLYKRPIGNFTGSAKTYTGAELKSVNPRNVIQALSVIDPSVRIAADNISGSDPNKLPNLQIRGANNLTLTTNTSAANPVSNGDIMASYLANPNQPLIIMDGFETTLQTLYDMDVNLIENITVLKDAAATVAYGSKAANGVIVVDTKQPVQGKLRASYGINANIELPDLTSYNLMDAASLLEAQRLSGVYNDPSNYFNDVAKQQWYNYRLAQVKSGVNTYWLSQPLQMGYGLTHSLQLSGGGSNLRYSFSLGYGNNEGVMKGSGRDRYSMGYNVSYSGKKIRVSNATSLAYVKGNNTPWGSFASYSKQLPFFRNNDEAGNPIKILEPNGSELGFGSQAPGGIFVNPEYNSTLNVKDYSTMLSLTNNSSIEWSLLDELKLTGSLGWSANTPQSEAFLPADHTSFADNIGLMGDLGSYQQTKGNNNVINGKVSLNYRLTFGKSTLLTAVGGQLQKTSSNGTTIKVLGIPNDYLGEIGLANGFSYSTLKPNTLSNLSKSVSNFASISYNFDNRYTAEVTANLSGSSQFGAHAGMTPFYAGGLSWNISNEKFFKPNDIIQSAKLRASIGTAGNQNISSDIQIYQYSLTNNYRLMLGSTTGSYANPDLQFQKTLKTNLGLSLGLLKGKINASLEVYQETTDNLILPLDIAPSTGFLSYRDNLGGTQNTGYEIGINANVIKDAKRNIFWTLGFNTGHYRNILTRLSPAIDAINAKNNATTDPNNPLNGRYQTNPLPRFVVGQSMSKIWAVPSLGIDPATGQEVFVKLDGSRTFVWDANDKRPIADATAKFKGSASSNFNYKNFVLNFNLMYQYGGYMYNQTLVDKVENVDLLHGNADMRVLTERWKQPGDHSSFKSLVANGLNGLQQTNATSRFVQKDNFIDLSSLTVGYNFPSTLKWVKASHLSAPKIMITQNNLVRLGTIKNERGTGYPFARSFSFGLSTNF
ncbi:SusC/RagA family TonB-linked outer membrane protein [Solitalea koreensis]|uniref:TonB-linked outer membrane protein, SusC/RagA family n=1 Tax=Solitalea koreensis TaxID=543615 RepID=A0A521DZ69_9SPHI|nr:SusC/RagA family TonB-linked outer membrane protein [Solitalea koreensis]SMO76928.1 TonB-linked outer membrane protein, SusC/RagA family [Solitalea koreensis]